jgi:hypothetical protein
MRIWVKDGFDLWLALIGASYTVPIWRWTIAPGRWSVVRQAAGGAALCMTWGYLIVGAEMLFGLTK